MDANNINKRIAELDEKIDTVRSEFDQMWFGEENSEKLKSMPMSMAYDKYLSERDQDIQVELTELKELRMHVRMTKVPVFTKIPDYGTLMPLDEFIDNVKSGGFIDYDGYGCYVNGDLMTDIEIYPSDIEKNKIRNEFDKIIWFNR
jgi:hypothetical protein